MSNELQDRIRRAVSSREFVAARRIWQEFAATIQDKHSRGALTWSELSAARDLCAWTLVTAQCARAHAQQRLNESKSASQAAQAYSEMAKVTGPDPAD